MTTSTSPPPIGEYIPLTPVEVFLLPAFLTLWIIVYYRAVLSPAGRPDGFDSSASISNLHSVPLCALALLSLLERLPESVPLCWSVSYFLVDLLDTVVRRDAVFFAHAVVSIVLNVLGGFSARHRALRSVSKGFFTEASTPFLNHWKKSKSFPSFVTFFVSFTLCRVIWVPLFLYRSYAIHLDGDIDFMIWPSALFYVLQLAWYAKMCTMVANYRVPKEVEDRLKRD